LPESGTDLRLYVNGNALAGLVAELAAMPASPAAR